MQIVRSAAAVYKLYLLSFKCHQDTQVNAYRREDLGTLVSLYLFHTHLLQLERCLVTYEQLCKIIWACFSLRGTILQGNGLGFLPELRSTTGSMKYFVQLTSSIRQYIQILVYTQPQYPDGLAEVCQKRRVRSP